MMRLIGETSCCGPVEIAGVPLGSFPEGDYRLEVKVTDKLGNKTITENVPFTVVAGS